MMQTTQIYAYADASWDDCPNIIDLRQGMCAIPHLIVQVQLVVLMRYQFFSRRLNLLTFSTRMSSVPQLVDLLH